MLPIDIKKLPVIKPVFSFFTGNNMDYAIQVTAIILFLLYSIYKASPDMLIAAFTFMVLTAPIWLPYYLWDIFFERWTSYVGKQFYLKTGRVLYRINLPQEVTKSPQAMEQVLNAIWTKQTADNYWQTYIDGKRPLPVSLEIASIGGEVRFYVNLNAKKTKESFVPAMYAQYPGIELVEEPVDYLAEFGADDPEWEEWYTHLNKSYKSGRWLPIKTYIDYGLDQMPKEEEKVDPLVTMLEFMSTMTPDERFVVQYVITPKRQGSLLFGQKMWPWEEEPKWQKDAEATVDEIMQRDPVTKGPLSKEGSDFDGMPRITPGERDDIEAIERNMEKQAYSVGIKYMYAAKKGKFRSANINPINNLFFQFGKETRSKIGQKWRTDYNYKWFSDPFGDRLRVDRIVEHKLFRLRKYVNHCGDDGSKIWTTEELATVFHIPGKVALTPTLSRVPSTRGDAPSNLPVGTPDNSYGT